MSWATAGSAIFRQFVADAVSRTAALDLSGTGIDSFKTALYNNTTAPDKDVTAANSAYNVDQWVTANEVFQAGQWAQGGVVSATMSISTPLTGVVMWDASADTASGVAATLTNVFGVMTYDDTLTTPVADQGVVFNYLGGSSGVTGGQLTIVWHANGLFRITT